MRELHASPFTATAATLEGNVSLRAFGMQPIINHRGADGSAYTSRLPTCPAVKHHLKITGHLKVKQILKLRGIR